MKFFVAKKDGMKCQGCSAEIMRGDDVFVSFKLVGNTKKAALFMYHTQCYIPWYTDMFNRKWSAWKNGDGNTVRPHRGRPVKYTDPTKEQQIRRLTALLSYHKGIPGHEYRVEKIKKSIKDLMYI
jgi:hypothetical protein